MKLLFLLDPRDDARAHVVDAATAAGWTTTLAARAADLDRLLAADNHDTVVFAPSLLDEDAIARVRRQFPDRTLVAWCAGASSSVAADLLDAGVDEVLTSTMGAREVRARIQHARRIAATSAVEVGRLHVDAGEATWDGRPLLLTRREREVLHVLADAAGKTVRREVVYRRVWGYAMARGDRSVDVNVKRLRDKLAAAGVGVQIVTQPGAGYRLEAAGDARVTAL